MENNLKERLLKMKGALEFQETRKNSNNKNQNSAYNKPEVAKGMGDFRVVEEIRKLEPLQKTPSIQQNNDSPEDLELIVSARLARLSIETLQDIMLDDDNPPQVRASVARYVMDRVLGTPVQKSEVQNTTVEYKMNISLEVPKPDSLKTMGVVFDDTITI
jgi:hypothetical protein